MGRFSKVRASALGVAAVGLVAAAGCSATQKAQVEIVTDATPTAVLSRAADTTTAVESGRIRLTSSISGVGGGDQTSVDMTGEGAFSDFGTRADLTVTVDGVTGGLAGAGTGPLVMREIVDGPTVYMKVESGAPLPGMGDGWVRMDAGAAANGAVTTDWGGFVASLKGAGSVTETGTDTLGGVPVTVYEGTIDPTAAAANASPEQADEMERALDQLGGQLEMPFTAWVDGDGLVRKLQVGIRAEMGIGSLDVTMTIELYDLGAPVTMTLPPADQVSDLGGIPGVSGLLGPELGTA